MKFFDLKNLKLMSSDLLIPDRCNVGGVPVRAKVYMDEGKQLVYQVNEPGKEYRQADSRIVGPYSEWKKLED